METLEEAVRRLIKSSYGSVSKFSDVIGVPVTSIYSALDRGLANTRTELTDKIYRELNIDWETARLDDDFRELRLKSQTSNQFYDCPLYGSIAAGTPIEMVKVEDTFPIPSEMHRRYPDAFLLRVKGESMNRILPNGCMALVDPCETIEYDGDPYAVCVNGFDATVKRVRALANGFELVPDSTDPTYKPTVYDYGVEGTETVTVIGRVVWYCIPFDWGF
jgi:repressor LexA